MSHAFDWTAGHASQRLPGFGRNIVATSHPLAAAMVSAWPITVAELPSKVIGLIEPFMGNQTLLLIAIMVLVMVVGTTLDMTPTILILTPVLMPVVKAASIDPVYFGVLSSSTTRSA